MQNKMASEKGKYYMSSLVKKLQENSPVSLYKALISLTRATKQLENVSKFREEGGIKMILRLIQSSNKKCINMGTSILANCALEKESRKEIINLDGLVNLNNLLVSMEDSDILGRVTRAFANLAVEKTTTDSIVNLDIISMLVSHLSKTEEAHFQQSLVRALRIISRNANAKRQLVISNGVQFVAKLLKSEDIDVKMCALQCIQELTKSGNRQISEQIQEFAAIESIIALTYADENKIRESAVLILSMITRHASVRVSVGTIGGIEAFINQVKEGVSRNLVLAAIEGVCMCCREAVNRNKVRSSGGLQVLMKVLCSMEFSQIHDKILGAFVCFSYDEIALRLFLSNGIIPLLLSALNKIVFQEKKNENIASEQDLQETEKDCTKVLVKDERTKLKIGTSSSHSHVIEKSTDHKNYTIYDNVTSPVSPPTVISPGCSPDHLSYSWNTSPVHGQCSSKESVASPMVYSPSGSEASCFSDEDSDADVTQEKVSCCVKEEMETFNTSGCLNKNQPSERKVPLHKDKTISGCKKATEITREDVGSISNQFSLFLPTEDLFSADHPSPKKRKVSAANTAGRRAHRQSYGSTSRSSTNTNHTPRSLVNNTVNKESPILTSILPPMDSPVPSTSSTPSSPYLRELEGSEKKILFLLSRFGQMPKPSEGLVTKDCIQTLLDYLLFSCNPDPRCVRLLTRLVWDINFFEALVLNMVPGAFYRQLECGFRPRYDLSSDDLQPQSKSPDNTKKIGQSMLLVLSNQACTSYGEGQLVHLLLRGSQKQKKSCALSLPYLCKHKRLKDKLLLSYNGLLLILSSLSSSEKSDNNNDDGNIMRAMEALHYLVSKSCVSFKKPEYNKLLFGKMTTKESLLSTAECSVSLLTTKEDNEGRSTADNTIPCGGRSSSMMMVEAQNDGRNQSKKATASSGEHSLSLGETDLDNIGISTTNQASSPGNCLVSMVDETLGYGGKSTTEEPPLSTGDCLVEKGTEEDGKSTKSSQCGVCLVPMVEDEHSPDKLTLSGDGMVVKSVFWDQCHGGCVYNKMKMESPDIVLKLDNGESIASHQSILINLSDVFMALLSNDWCHEREVLIQDISYSVLLTIVHYAYGCIWSFQSHTNCSFLQQTLVSVSGELDCNIIADLLVCADRFFLDTVKQQCTKLLLYNINRMNASELYKYGACYNTPVLRISSLKYAFSDGKNLRVLYEYVKCLLDCEGDIFRADLRQLAMECF